MFVVTFDVVNVLKPQITTTRFTVVRIAIFFVSSDSVSSQSSVPHEAKRLFGHLEFQSIDTMVSKVPTFAGKMPVK